MDKKQKKQPFFCLIVTKKWLLFSIYFKYKIYYFSCSFLF